MDDTAFTRIFGGGRGRSTYGTRLVIRDAAFIADLKARISGRVARENRERGAGWLISFSPTRTDDLTERSLFDAVLTTAAGDERRLPVAVGRDWVQIGGGAMESSVRTSADNIARALDKAFRRAVPAPAGSSAPAEGRATAA